MSIVLKARVVSTSFITDAMTDIEYSLDEMYPDGQLVHETVSTDCFGCDPMLLVDFNRRLHSCTSVEEIEAIFKEMQSCE